MKISVYIMDIGRFQWELPENEKKAEELIGRLSAERQEKIRRFRFEKGKHLSLGAGLLLDYGLQAFGLRERDVRIGKGKFGKPYLSDYPEIHFNLSHSGSMVMAAFGDREVGCDVEQMADANEKVAERFFSEEEKRALEACGSKKQRTELFYRIWTRKESYLKLTGEGMHTALDSFCVLPGTGKLLAGHVPCIFREFPVSGYQAAVCVMQEDGTEELFCSFQNLHDVV